MLIADVVTTWDRIAVETDACIAIQIKRESGGFAIGDQVAIPLGKGLTGTLRAFTCTADRRPAALLLVDTQSRAWLHIEALDNLKRVTP